MDALRQQLSLSDPFISENGGGIFFPKESCENPPPSATLDGDYWKWSIGLPYNQLVKGLHKIREELGWDMQGLSDMTAEKVSHLTGLDMETSRLAVQREFDEPFIFSGDQARLSTLVASIEEMGFRYAEGRICHILGDSDKGKAVDILTNLYQRKFGKIVTIALGDSPVDFSMLEKVDHPVLVRNYKGEHDRRIALPNLIKVEGIGPKGWNKAVPALIEDR